MSKRILSKQHGIGLLELMLSLLVIAAILFSVIRYFGVTNQSLKVTQAVDMINTLTDASYKWVQGQPDFSTVSLHQLNNAGLIPANYLFASANPWKSSVNVQPSSDNSKIVIIINGIPPTGCESLKEKMQKYAADAQCAGSSLQTFSGTF